MARKLYALALEKCAAESADSPMMQEVLLGGHLYLMSLKVRQHSSFDPPRPACQCKFFCSTYPCLCRRKKVFAGLKIMFGKWPVMLTGQINFSSVVARFKMLKTSKPLIGIHKAAERDRLICFLRIYNGKYLKYFTI